MDQEFGITRRTIHRTIFYSVIVFFAAVFTEMVGKYYFEKSPIQIVLQTVKGNDSRESKSGNDSEEQELAIAIKIENMRKELRDLQVKNQELEKVIESGPKIVTRVENKKEATEVNVRGLSLVSSPESIDDSFEEIAQNTSLSKKNIKGTFFDRDTKITCGIAAVVGGALGAAIKDNNRSKGALYGSVIAGGACIAIKYYSKRVKRSNEVAKEYYAQRKSFPTHTQTTLYQVQSEPKSQVRRGGTLVINSLLNVIQGSKDKELKMVENIFVFNKRTDELVDYYSKDVNPDWQDGGRFQNEYKIRLSNEITPGPYEVKTVLTVNGKSTKSNDIKIKVI